MTAPLRPFPYPAGPPDHRAIEQIRTALNQLRDRLEYVATLGGGGGGGVSDGDKGDIVVSGGGTAWAFDPGVVTAAGRALLDDANAAAQRTTLGLGTAAEQPASAFAASSHTHPQSDVTGLVAALANKSDVGHGHAQSDVTGLVAALSGKSDVGHGHAQADITGLVSALAGKSDVGHTHDASAITSGVFDAARLPLFGPLVGGAVPASGGSSILFLRGDGLWAVPGGTPIYVRKPFDQNLIGSTYTTITDMGISMWSGEVWAFEYNIIADVDATTTGIDLAVTGPISPTAINYTQELWTSATTKIYRPATVYDSNPANPGSAGTTRAIYRVSGIIRVGGAAGTLQPRIKREAVGSGPNVRVGSYGVGVRLT